ncbi:hypothetical protein FQN60_000674, partial [Etheostoma spectabile]
MAIAATSELLEDIRGAAGDKTFLQMMGIAKGKALCFVIDTTGSMRDDIEAVKAVTSSIINTKVGTEDEPPVYILVPFNDPDFGPLIRTTDPDVFKRAINALSANDGGDIPELSLSGLQVNFMITNILGFRRRKRSDDSQEQGQQNSRILTSDVQVYRDLAQASGGLAIQVTKSELPMATSIITESSSSSLVTLVQASRSSGMAENFTFTVDESVTNLTVYITARSVSFILISPSGVSQENTNTTGSLITASQSVGNFWTLQLKTQVGLWEIKMVSTNPYILKVVGESPIDFLFEFLEVSQGPLGGFDVVNNRPRSGVNGSLIVTVTGSDSATVTEVILVASSGSRKVNGSVEAQGGGDFLARFDRIPEEEFVVLVKGQNSNGSSRASSVIFQRQSSTNIRASAVTVASPDSNSVLVPGTTLSVPFSVTTSGVGGTFIIQATNDQGFNSTFPSNLILANGGSANGTVNLTAPSNTLSGTVVTLTVEAVAPGGTDANYVVLRFTVTDGAEGTGVNRVSLRQGNGTLNTSLAADNKTITLVSYRASCCSPDVVLLVVDGVGQSPIDFLFYLWRQRKARSQDVTHVPELLSLQSNCSNNCILSMWELSVCVTDGAEGTGVDHVSLREGNGTLNTSRAGGNKNIMLVSYSLSCCSPNMKMLVLDRVGNVGTGFYSSSVSTN